MKNQDYNIKGIKSIFIPDILKWKEIEKLFKNLIEQYSYNEIRLQLLEKVILFNKTLSDDTDIIKKEMFSFLDKGGNFLTLIPEGTVPCLKELYLKGYLRNNNKLNVWYLSPIFRRENPQKGRNRLFYQIGLESYGFRFYDKEIEHLLIFNKLFKSLFINDIILEINCINNDENNLFKIILFIYLKKNIINFFKLKNLFKINILVILEKLKKTFLLNIPHFVKYLNSNKRRDFYKFLYNLKKIGIYYIYNNKLIRGLNYYNGIIYEWTSFIGEKKLAICAGGRYDNLSKLIFNKDFYSTGCALGIDRLVLKINFLNIDLPSKLFICKEIPFYLRFNIIDYFSFKKAYIFANIDYSSNEIKNNNNFLFVDRSFIKNNML